MIEQRPRRFAWAAFSCLSLAVVSLGGCRTKPQPRDLTSLRRSGAVSFFCIGKDRTPASLDECALSDVNRDGGFDVGPPDYDLHALITQTLSAEVAVVNVTATSAGGRSRSKVLDVDVTNPGITPLRVGEQPMGIATTPGGSASFVTVAEAGKEGIFGLPTRCIFAPTTDETRRDLTTWPACRLSSAPGELVVVVDDGQTSDGAKYCGDGPDGSASYAQPDGECSVDLGQESFQPGRRKLVVALPFEGKLVVLDAQELLDREPGSYDDCHIEAELELDGTFPANVLQPLPDDLVHDGKLSASYPDLVGQYTPSPAGMDYVDGLLAVADQGAPLVHLLDVRDPCSLHELAPLLATSYSSPGRVVRTSHVAISPLTKYDQQFLYAVDEVGEELASIIPFDISQSSTNRLPMLRPGSPLLPFEPPDRISFGAAVKDVAFAEMDSPITDPVIGQSFTEVECDPNPRLSEDSLEAQYRPGSGSVGAAPSVLRGVFAYALLSSGRLSVVDVLDYDNACRRPIELNPSSTIDFRGCKNDDPRFDYYTDDQTQSGAPTVSNEASCRVVVPHRARSARFIDTVDGSAIQAPALRSYAQLSRFGRGLSVNRKTPEGKRNPILLGADFEAPPGQPSVPAQVYLGSTLLRRDVNDDQLVIDPNVAERAAPVLPFYEPRAYPLSEAVSVVFEGDIERERFTGNLSAPEAGVSRFEDEGGAYCARGVQDRRLTEQMAEQRFGLSGGSSERFVDRHTDYVQVTNLLFDQSDAYWKNEGASCGEGLNLGSGRGYELCDSVFRIGDADDLARERDLTVVEAFDDHLLVTPRGLSDPDAAQARLELMRCCFPTTMSYRIRAGNQWVVRGGGTGFEHPVTYARDSEDAECIYDTSPLVEYQWGRAFEVSNNNCQQTDPEAPDACGVGPRTTQDVVCSYDATRGPVELGGPGSECIFNSLTRRFVVYRGLSPSLRDTAFSAEVIGGFQGLGISLSSNSSTILPASMKRIGDFPVLGVVDSQNNGLSMVDLLSSRVAENFY